MNRNYTLSKTLWKQKSSFWVNLVQLGKGLLSNALNRDNLQRKKVYNKFKTLVN